MFMLFSILQLWLTLFITLKIQANSYTVEICMQKRCTCQRVCIATIQSGDLHSLARQLKQVGNLTFLFSGYAVQPGHLSAPSLWLDNKVAAADCWGHHSTLCLVLVSTCTCNMACLFQYEFCWPGDYKRLILRSMYTCVLTHSNACNIHVCSVVLFIVNGTTLHLSSTQERFVVCCDGLGSPFTLDLTLLAPVHIGATWQLKIECANGMVEISATLTCTNL